MILWLVDCLQEGLGWNVPLAFVYSSTRIILSALTTLGLSIFLGPWFISRLYAWRIGQPIRKEECPLLGKLHEKKEDTPTMGGILILTCVTASMVLWMDWGHSFSWLLLISLWVLGGLGAYDDWLKLKYRRSDGLSARRKLGVQVLLSAAIAAYLLCPWVTEAFSWVEAPTALDGRLAEAPVLTTKEYASRLYLPFYKHPLFEWGAVVAGLFVVFVVTGSSNAVNLTDGLDGLAAGCLILVCATLAVFAFLANNAWIADYLNILYIDGSGEIAVFLSGVVGACLGFLWYNGHPAQVFMGDTGSLALGGVTGLSAVLLKRELILALVGGIFVAEALSVILQVLSFRYRGGKRIFLCAPLHHHFEYKGWPETKVVVRFWIVGLILAMLGLVSLKFQ